MPTHFTHRNDGFKCLKCGAGVLPARATCRNHCPKCLYSRHVDVIPGDRACACKGLMKPVSIVIKSASAVAIIHQCETCGKEQKNKIAEDDAREAIMRIIERK